MDLTVTKREKSGRISGNGDCQYESGIVGEGVGNSGSSGKILQGFTIRGHPFMTSALRGEEGLENLLILRTNSTDRSCEMQTGGSKILKILRKS